MGAKDLTKYLNDKDKHGVKIKAWATQVAPGMAECNVCVPVARVKFEKGKKELFNQSESAKHRKNRALTITILRIKVFPSCLRIRLKEIKYVRMLGI